MNDYYETNPEDGMKSPKCNKIALNTQNVIK